MSSEVTKHAQLVAEVCEQEIAKVESELDQLETEINPALDDNALVAFSYVLGTVVDAMKQVPEVHNMSAEHTLAGCSYTFPPLLHRAGLSTNLYLPKRFQTTTRSSRPQWICRQ